MKCKGFLFSLLLLAGVTPSCEKSEDHGPDTLNLTGFRSGNTSELVNVKLKSGKVTANPVDCYLLGSTLYESKTGAYGYVDCHGKFNLLDPLTGNPVLSVTVPEFLSQTVIDTLEGVLIGRTYEETSNYIYKINLETGEVVGRNPVDLSPGVFACTYYYRAPQKEYVLMKADSTLVFINPGNGEIVRSPKAAAAPANAYYDALQNRLIGVTYDAASDRNFLVTLDAASGVLVHQVQISERNDYYACMSGFDPETNCYLLLNPDNHILFIDIETGDNKDSYDIGFQLQEFKFWKGRITESEK
jgi:hypothetical protein